MLGDRLTLGERVNTRSVGLTPRVAPDVPRLMLGLRLILGLRLTLGLRPEMFGERVTELLRGERSSVDGDRLTPGERVTDGERPGRETPADGLRVIDDGVRPALGELGRLRLTDAPPVSRRIDGEREVVPGDV